MYQFRVKTLKREATKKNEKKEAGAVYKYFSERKSALRYCYKNMMLYYEDIRTGKRITLNNQTAYIIYEVRRAPEVLRYYQKSADLLGSIKRHEEPTAHSLDLAYKYEADNLKSIADAFGYSAHDLTAYIIEDLDSIEEAESIHLLKDKYIIYKTALDIEEIEDSYEDLEDTSIILL